MTINSEENKEIRQLILLGDDYRESNKLGDALLYYRQAIDVFEEQEFSSLLAEVVTKVTETQCECGEYELAVNAYRNTLKICSEIKEFGCALRGCAALRKLLRNEQKYQIAIEYSRELLLELGKYDQHEFYAYTIYQMMLLYELCDDHASAKDYFAEFSRKSAKDESRTSAIMFYCDRSTSQLQPSLYKAYKMVLSFLLVEKDYEPYVETLDRLCRASNNEQDAVNYCDKFVDKCRENLELREVAKATLLKINYDALLPKVLQALLEISEISYAKGKRRRSEGEGLGLGDAKRRRENIESEENSETDSDSNFVSR